MWLLAGLGNPGEKYRNNRHNVGFMVIDAIADHFGFASFRSKYQGHLSEGEVDGTKVILLKPMTYMNESGKSIGSTSSFYKIEPYRIVVFHDELDLEPGVVRVKKGGGNAGHNGLKSAQAHLGSPDFWRVRIGIGHPGDRDRVSDYVLSDFSKADAAWVSTLCEKASKNASDLIHGREAEFAEKLSNTDPNQERFT